MDINSLGEKTIETLFEMNLVKSVADLYKLKAEDIKKMEGFKDLSTQNLLEGIARSKDQPFANVLFGLGIRYAGKTVAEKLANHFLSIDRLATAPMEELLSVPEIGQKIAESVFSWFRDEENIRLIKELKSAGLRFEGEELKSENNILKGKTFVISGVFQNYEREELKMLIKKSGGKILSSVSTGLNYLLAGDKMGPSKLQKAREMGITILTEEEFVKMIK
jgi:DNA ligase (NAD+)